MRAKSSKHRCPALCLIDLSYNVKYHWSCRVGGCSGHLTASGSWQDFPGVDHEGRQDVAVTFYCCFPLSFMLIIASMREYIFTFEPSLLSLPSLRVNEVVGSFKIYPQWTMTSFLSFFKWQIFRFPSCTCEFFGVLLFWSRRLFLFIFANKISWISFFYILSA